MTYITDIRYEKVVHSFEEEGQVITSLEFNPKTYTMTTGCKGKNINYYDLETFEIINNMSFNTSPIKEIKFYNKDEFELVEWGFFGSDDYIRLINLEKNKQQNVYGVMHDTLHDMQVNYKNGILTCLCAYKNEMTYSGVKLPEVDQNPEDEDDDMEVDSVPSFPNQPKVTGSSPKQYRARDVEMQMNEIEEVKGPSRFVDQAAIRTHVQDPAYAHAVPSARDDHPDTSNYDVNESLQMTTFKPSPESVPAGIDFDEFSGASNTLEYQEIEKMSDKHFQFLDSLRQRQQKIRNILSLYSPYKNINMTLNALEQMNDIGVTNDVYSAMFVEGTFAEKLSMKQCLSTLPHAESLFDSKHENHIITGAYTISKVLKHIGQDIITLRNYPATKGVDLQREERLNQCNDLLHMFLGIFKGKTLNKRIKHKGNIGKV